ncbi:Tyrosyl-tRNA synthetase [Hordeum vulgare]|nr:Tyrosyl-tRNA synthetase [Hordeum vulgare]
MKHLHRQAPQDKLTKIKSVTSTSYYDFDIDFKIPSYGTHDAKEYLNWERKMDTYVKLLQVPLKQFGALKVEQELKAKVTQPRAHFGMTKLHEYEPEDGTTKMSKPDELQDNAPKSDFTTIRLCDIDYAESSTTLFEDDAVTTATMESLKEHDLEARNRVARKDDASILRGEIDDVPSSPFIHDEVDDMVEHGIFPSTTVAFGVELRDCIHHIESESVLTTSPICDEFLQFPCERDTTPTT